MRRLEGWARALFGLAVVAPLAGCAWFDQTTAGLYSAIAGTGESIGAPWGGARPDNPSADLTIQRVRSGLQEAAAPLQAEPGDVWPVPEARRTTLRNPDQALTNIPGYRPDVPRDQGNPPPPPRTRGSAGPATPPLEPLATPATPPPRPPLPPGNVRLPPAAIQTPRGDVVPSTGTDRYQTYTAPGGGTGVITRDGGLTTIRRPDGSVETVPTPR